MRRKSLPLENTIQDLMASVDFSVKARMNSYVHTDKLRSDLQSARFQVLALNRHREPFLKKVSLFDLAKQDARAHFWHSS